MGYDGVPASRSASPSLGAPYQFDQNTGKVQDPYAEFRKLFREQVTNSPNVFRTPIFADCQHEMKTYNGFTESYRYCTKCDHKETT